MREISLPSPLRDLATTLKRPFVKRLGEEGRTFQTCDLLLFSARKKVISRSLLLLFSSFFGLDSEEKKKKGRQCIIILLVDGINVCGTLHPDGERKKVAIWLFINIFC